MPLTLHTALWFWLLWISIRFLSSCILPSLRADLPPFRLPACMHHTLLDPQRKRSTHHSKGSRRLLCRACGGHSATFSSLQTCVCLGTPHQCIQSWIHPSHLAFLPADKTAQLAWFFGHWWVPRKLEVHWIRSGTSLNTVTLPVSDIPSILSSEWLDNLTSTNMHRIVD